MFSEKMISGPWRSCSPQIQRSSKIPALLPSVVEDGRMVDPLDITRPLCDWPGLTCYDLVLIIIGRLAFAHCRLLSLITFSLPSVQPGADDTSEHRSRWCGNRSEHSLDLVCYKRDRTFSQQSAYIVPCQLVRRSKHNDETKRAVSNPKSSGLVYYAGWTVRLPGKKITTPSLLISSLFTTHSEESGRHQ